MIIEITNEEKELLIDAIKTSSLPTKRSLINILKMLENK